MSADLDLPLERDVARLLADGDLDAAARRVREGGRATLFTELVDLDIRSRLVLAELPELLHLRERLEADAAANARYGLWLSAIMAEHMVVAGDAASILWAVMLLRDVTDEPYPAFPVLYARGRLRRIAAAIHLLEPSPASLDRLAEGLDGAVTDFVRCGFHAEVAVTTAVAAGYVFLRTGEDPWGAYDRLKEGRAVLGDVRTSTWGLALDALRGYVALLVGDLAGAHQAWDDADAHPATHPLIEAHNTVGRAVAHLIGERATPASIDAVEQAIDAVRLRTPLYVPGFNYQVAHVLADFGRPEVARFSHTVAGGVPTAQELQLLELRTRLVAGEVPSAADAKALLAELAAHHRARVAGYLAVRLARDYERLGQYGEGEALRQWGLERLPGPAGLTLWELLLSRPLGGAPRSAATAGRAAPAGPAGPAPAGGDEAVSVRVLEPQVLVGAGDELVRLRDSAAKLLLALVIAHPHPMNIERAADVLWPDVDLRTARTRLNTLVHRLRSAAPALARGIRRDGNLLTLDDGDCNADLIVYRRRLAGSPEERRAALLSVRGNLCEAQFPYDEPFIDERRALVSSWRRVARELVASGVVTPAELAAPAAALGVELDDLATADPLADRL